MTQELSRDDLISTRWSFGARHQAPLTNTFRFGETGDVQGYHHDNEARWRLHGAVLEIYQRSGLLMWVSQGVFEQDDSRRFIVLQSQLFRDCEFVLTEYKAPLAPADFLFPKDLQVTPTKFQRILLIGSCLTTMYQEEFSRHYPEIVFDRILFNMAGDLPDEPPAPVTAYDFQYVQLPLRSVIGDRIIWANRFNDAGFSKEILEDGFNVIDVMLAAAMRYNQAHGLLTLVSNFFVPQMNSAPSLRTRNRPADLPYIVRRLNDYLAEAVERYNNSYIADVNAIGDSVGKQYVLDDVIFFYSHGAVQMRTDIDPTAGSRIETIPPIASFYESKVNEFIQAVYEQMNSIYRTVRQIDQVKAVVFDLDHTLWRGQLVEHYRPDDAWPASDGWPMGLWEALQHLRARGILIAVCSKNDHETVEKNWANAVRPAFISLEDFSSVKINWQPKAENIRAICEQFNIKPKNVVFVDDNPVERAAVKAALPGIRAIGSNPLLTRRILLWAAETQVSTLTDESIRREDMIRKQIVREETRAAMSREQFLATLGCTVKFTRIDDTDHPDFARTLELINKTNQFNTTAKRWEYAGLKRFLASNGTMWAFSVTDRFADYGLVGVLLIAASRIDQFVMSCRVLGMEVECAAVAHVSARLRRDGHEVISAALVATADNTPCRGVYAKCGFTLSPRSEQGQLVVLAPDVVLDIPSHIRIAG
jgi:FkbH-like protein